LLSRRHLQSIITGNELASSDDESMDKQERVDELETVEALPPGQNVNDDRKRKQVGISSLCSWWDLMLQCF